MAPIAAGPCGVLVVDKPGRMTSHDVVSRVRRMLKTRRIGHAGTLDPIATGVLVLLVGNASRIADRLAATTKTYEADVTFGLRTTTQDSTGEVLAETSAGGLDAQGVLRALRGFEGDGLQRPPMVSAVHHQGQRLYHLARKGIEVEREPRPIRIDSLELLSFDPGEKAVARLRVVCSAGTYIRTLAADLGDTLGCGACLSALRRTASGRFTIADAVPLGALESSGDIPLRSIVTVLPELPRIRVTEEQVVDVRRGRDIPVLNGLADAGEALLLDPRGLAISLGRAEAGRAYPGRWVAPYPVEEEPA